MSGFGTGRKRRQQAQILITNKFRQNKGIIKSAIEDTYPFDIPNIQSISPQIKQYINQLERQYIQRYNILNNNRAIYQEIVDNVSTQLDQKGVQVQKLGEIYKKYISTTPKGKIQQYPS